jgi:hypothetical protein
MTKCTLTFTSTEQLFRSGSCLDNIYADYIAVKVRRNNRVFMNDGVIHVPITQNATSHFTRTPINLKN